MSVSNSSTLLSRLCLSSLYLFSFLNFSSIAYAQKATEGSTNTPSATTGGRRSAADADLPPHNISAGGEFSLFNEYDNDNSQAKTHGTNGSNNSTSSNGSNGTGGTNGANTKIPIEATEAQSRASEMRTAKEEDGHKSHDDKDDKDVNLRIAPPPVEAPAIPSTANYWEQQRLKRKEESKQALILKQEEGRIYQSPSF